MLRSLFIAVLVANTSRGDVIDRVAVSVENSVIAESEILRQIRLTAFLNNEPVVFTSEKKRETADRLVEQLLIRREIATTRYLPENPEAYLPAYESLRKNISSDDWQARLARYDVTDAEVRDALHWQATFLDFVQVRFRPGIQVPESDVHVYYDAEVGNKPNPPAFEEVRDHIESMLIEQRVNAAIDRWLGQTRTQTQIRYRPEAFE